MSDGSYVITEKSQDIESRTLLCDCGHVLGYHLWNCHIGLSLSAGMAKGKMWRVPM